MKLLIEEQSYPFSLIKGLELSPYFFHWKENEEAQIPYVGYFYSQDIKDSVFILPKVFMMCGVHPKEPEMGEQYLAFGKWHPYEIIDIESSNNPLKENGFDKVIFGLATWIYQAIQIYSKRNPSNQIVENAKIQNVISNKGDYTETFLDVILSLIKFHKDHKQLFTCISIINSSGNHKIHWTKTISKVQPIIKDNKPYYLKFLNKNKIINYDEEIIVLFYSVLAYLRQKYCFPIKVNLNYPIIQSHKVKSMIESGKGTRLLRSIRRKYFTDELVALWKLLYVFFEKAETIANRKYHEEALLVHNFNMVFEDMVDSLISDKCPASIDLKTNKDDKRIDHIYKNTSLIEPDQIYFIADSKYYKETTDIQGVALYKQYTYARNIIQYNIDIFNKSNCGRSLNKSEEETINNVRYRDELTEGYNITPNFFIRGSIGPEDINGGVANYTEPRLQPEKEGEEDIIRTSEHFYNRLFDRDTLVLESYNINFLFVLSSYVIQKDNRAFQERVKRDFRTHLINTFNKQYNFYHVTPSGNSLKETEAFVSKYFKKLIGKIYRSSDSETLLWLALNKKELEENEKLIELLKKEADIKQVTL